MAFTTNYNYTSQPIAWGDPRFQNLYSSIMDRGMQLEDTKNIPALSDQYWNNMKGNAITASANSQLAAQNQLAQLMARRGLTGSGAEVQGMRDIMLGGAANRTNALTNLYNQRQQSDISNYWKAQQLRNQMAGLGLQTSNAIKAGQNAAAAAGMARDRFDWNKKMDAFNMMLKLQQMGVNNNQNIFNTALQGYMQPQATAFNAAYRG